MVEREHIGSRQGCRYFEFPGRLDKYLPGFRVLRNRVVAVALSLISLDSEGAAAGIQRRGPVIA